MITDAFCAERESLFSPEAFLGERKFICDTAIATFSNEIHDAVLRQYPHREIAHIGTANGHKPIYLLDVGGQQVVFYMSGIGGCLSGCNYKFCLNK